MRIHSRIKEEGSFKLDGRVFKWAYDEADILEVWNWQYERTSDQLRKADREKLARELALKLLDARDYRRALRIDVSLHRKKASLTERREHSPSIAEKQIWVIREVKIKAEGNSRKKPSVAQRKNEN